LFKFIGEADVGQIARNHDVIQRQPTQVVKQSGQDLTRMRAPPPESPGQVAERTLVQEIADLNANQ
jgi:hypothetical protein